MMEKWDKSALADYVKSLIRDLDGDCVEADISFSRNFTAITIEVEGKK